MAILMKNKAQNHIIQVLFANSFLISILISTS